MINYGVYKAQALFNSKLVILRYFQMNLLHFHLIQVHASQPTLVQGTIEQLVDLLKYCT